MRIVVCSSVHFSDESMEIKRKLAERGFEAFIYPRRVKVNDKTVSVGEFYAMRKRKPTEELIRAKRQLMDRHIEKIKNSDAVLILNFDKPNCEGYVGGNTFLEMGIAHYMGKKVFVWKKPAESLPYFEEIMAIEPIVIDGDLDRIR